MKKKITCVLVNAVEICGSPEVYDVDSCTTNTAITTITSVSLRGTESSLT
jgi:hypothetical protein